MEEKNFVTSLLRKLTTRLHGAKITQTVAGLLIATSLTLPLTGCQINITPNGNGSYDVDVNKNPSNNSQNNNSTNNQTNSNNQTGNNSNNNTGENNSNNQTNNNTNNNETGSGNNSENNSGNSSNNNNNENPDNNENEEEIQTPKYSEILQNVMDDEYYDALIADAKDPNGVHDKNNFQPHPYAFLEDEGFDVEAIKSGQIKAYTMSYVLDEDPNNLYINTRVEEGNNYVSYILKYNLTDQEMSDYFSLHRSGHAGYNYFLQACFINNEISESKTPEAVSEVKISKESFEGFTSSLQAYKFNLGDYYDFVLTGVDKPSNSITYLVIPRYNNTKLMSDRNLILFGFADTYFKLNESKEALTEIGSFRDLNNNETSKTRSTIFIPQHTDLFHGLCGDFESVNSEN